MKHELANRTFCQETLSLRKRLESAFIELAERLMKIRDQRLYADDYENFAAFLWELKMSEGTASRLISVYQTFVQTHGLKRDDLSKVGWSHLYTMIPLATSKEKAQELVDSASMMRRDDIADMVRIGKHGACKHPAKDRYEITLEGCRACGAKSKKHEEG